ncbi:hypothetical protein AB0M12_18325 [Nocardia vinacea]|uniref:hypothetical protein n=1 Tax=Nocardia vinacea TaxID=96468 RepID=UPI00341590C3
MIGDSEFDLDLFEMSGSGDGFDCGDFGFDKGPGSGDGVDYMRVVNPHVYTAFVNEALSVGHRVPVIVDAPFIGHIREAAKQGRSLSDYIRSTATTPAPSVQTVWISADPNQIRERMARRGAPRDVGKLANWEAYRSDVLESGIDAAAKTVVDHVVRNTCATGPQ